MADTSLVAKFVMDVAALAPEGDAPGPAGSGDPEVDASVTEIVARTREFLRVAASWEQAMTETNRLERHGASPEPLHFAREAEQRAYQQTVAAQRALDQLVTRARDSYGEFVLTHDPRWHLLEMVDDCFAQALSEHHTRYFAKGPLGAI